MNRTERVYCAFPLMISGQPLRGTRPGALRLGTRPGARRLGNTHNMRNISFNMQSMQNV